MNTASTEEAKTRYYSNRETLGVWSAIVACVGVIGGGSSIAAHSVAVTSSLLFGTLVVWFLGYWALSKSCYFISPAKVGFKDAFRSREVLFEEIESVTRNTTSESMTLTFECKTRTVTMPLDPIDETWFSDLKTELLDRGIKISNRALGFKVKGE